MELSNWNYNIFVFNIICRSHTLQASTCLSTRSTSMTSLKKVYHIIHSVSADRQLISVCLCACLLDVSRWRFSEPWKIPWHLFLPSRDRISLLLEGTTCCSKAPRSTQRANKPISSVSACFRYKQAFRSSISSACLLSVVSFFKCWFTNDQPTYVYNRRFFTHLCFYQLLSGQRRSEKTQHKKKEMNKHIVDFGSVGLYICMYISGPSWWLGRLSLILEKPGISAFSYCKKAKAFDL